MLAALYGTLASRGIIIAPGETTFYSENVPPLDVLFGPPPNTLFYAELTETVGLTIFGPPPNSLFYAEVNETVGLTSFGPPPNSLFYAESMDSNPVTLFSPSDFLQIYTEVEDTPVPIQYGMETIYFVDENEDDANLETQIGFLPTSAETLFFNTDEGLSVIPLSFGST